MGRSRLLVVLVAPALLLITLSLLPDPDGHWAEHAGSASFKAGQASVVAFLAFRLRDRLPPIVLLVTVAACAAMAVQSYGDWYIADLTWRTTGDPLGGTEHDITSNGDLGVLATGLLFAIAVGVTRLVRWPLALLAAALVIIPPPFLWPSFGIMVVLLVLAGGEPARHGPSQLAL